jgi:hypothetical protein
MATRLTREQLRAMWAKRKIPLKKPIIRDGSVVGYKLYNVSMGQGGLNGIFEQPHFSGYEWIQDKRTSPRDFKKCSRCGSSIIKGDFFGKMRGVCYTCKTAEGMQRSEDFQDRHAEKHTGSDTVFNKGDKVYYDAGTFAKPHFVTSSVEEITANGEIILADKTRFDSKGTRQMDWWVSTVKKLTPERESVLPFFNDSVEYSDAVLLGELKKQNDIIRRLRRLPDDVEYDTEAAYNAFVKGARIRQQLMARGIKIPEKI